MIAIREYSDYGKILSYFQNNPTKELTAIPFTNGEAVFVGYSASARLCELRDMGLLKVVGTEDGKKGQKFNKYGITTFGASFKLTKFEDNKLIKNNSIETYIVEKGEVKKEFLTQREKEINEFLGSTNIPNPNYKPWYKRLFNF